MIDLRRHWWPLATAAELPPGRTLARTLLGVPLVLFREAGGRAAVLLDRCPHRQAPLSAGRVREGRVECPYHGWRFDGTGRCTRVPGVEQAPGERPLVRAMAVREAHGLVWACLAGDPSAGEPGGPTEPAARMDAFFMTARVAGTIEQAAENFLDGFHTHFVHAGLVRSDRRRQPVRATVRMWPRGVEARYSGESGQAGWVSRWLEGERTGSFGRFSLPGLAEIEYRGGCGTTLLVSAWLTPETASRLRVHARVATARGWLPAWVKRRILQRVFGMVLRQDREMLEKLNANLARFGPEVPADWLPAPLNGPQDLLGPWIGQLMAGRELPSRSLAPVDLQL